MPICTSRRRFLIAVLCLAAVFLAGAGVLAVHSLVWASPSEVRPAQAHGREATLRERLAKPCVGAHRGGSTAADSNTLARFEAAYEAGVDIIEMDLRLTADGVPIVYHDPGLDRGWFRSDLPVAESTLAQIRQHKVDGHDIPTFAEVLEWADGRVVLNAEFKEREVVKPAVRLAREHDAYEWVYFQLKSDPGRYVLAREEDEYVALLFKPDTAEEFDWMLGLEDDRLLVVEFHEPMRTEENIRRVHAAGKFASENSWHFAPLQETFGAACKRAWDAGMDIAITKHPRHGVLQREAYRARQTGRKSE